VKDLNNANNELAILRATLDRVVAELRLDKDMLHNKLIDSITEVASLVCGHFYLSLPLRLMIKIGGHIACDEDRAREGQQRAGGKRPFSPPYLVLILRDLQILRRKFFRNSRS
jgi:hypothetical protein